MILYLCPQGNTKVPPNENRKPRRIVCTNVIRQDGALLPLHREAVRAANVGGFILGSYSVKVHLVEQVKSMCFLCLQMFVALFADMSLN